MIEVCAVAQGPAQGLAIPQVAMHLFNFEAFEVPQVAAGADQHADLDAGGHQRAGDRAAHESCRAGDEGPHGTC